MLLISALISAGGMVENWKYVFPLFVHIILLFVLNRFYFRVYKYYPFQILADNEKMICKDFMNRRKILKINYSEIISIKGGVFSGNSMRPVYIETSSGQLIGINQHIKNFNQLLTIILSNIPKELYSALLKSMKDLSSAENPGKNKKARRKRA
jgi:hypothetical protein